MTDTLNRKNKLQKRLGQPFAIAVGIVLHRRRVTDRTAAAFVIEK